MPAFVQLSDATQALLRCPACHAGLAASGETLVCSGPDCARVYPVVDGKPVLINEAASVFTLAEFEAQQDTFFRHLNESRLKRGLRRLVPSIGANLKGAGNYRRMAEMLLSDIGKPHVLVLGGGILGEGMEALADRSEIELVETDVSLGPRTRLICDAHDIPFADGCFDGVIAQAVLEHVADPVRCTEEIFRVLKPGGVLYAETPFMQQVHGGPYDFTRFTHSGHRRLFRRFTEVDSGAVCGPGMALAWAYKYFLLSFARSDRMRRYLRAFAHVTSFYLKYFDRFLIDRPGSLDAASGLYFLGRKGSGVLPDRELLAYYQRARQDTG